METIETPLAAQLKRWEHLEKKRHENLRRTWEEAHTKPLREAFVKTYGVKEYKYSYRNLANLLTYGGAGEKAVHDVLDRWFGPTPKYRAWIGDVYGKGNVFDHAELWGRDRRPLFFIGHPYNVDPDGEYASEDAKSTIEALRSIGMTVLVLSQDHSWYGNGTYQVVVSRPVVVRGMCAVSPRIPDYPFATPPARKPWPGREEAERLLTPLYPHLAPRPHPAPTPA